MTSDRRSLIIDASKPWVLPDTTVQKHASDKTFTMGGKACIRGMRVTVGRVVSQIGARHSIDEILADYPYLEREDIMQALRYAAWLAEEREVTLANA